MWDVYKRQVKEGEYSKSGSFTCLNKPYYEIENKVWGIIGLGAIGNRVGKIAEAFGAEVIYYSTSGKNSSTQFKKVSFEELLEKSDIISIHAPLNENTKGCLLYTSFIFYSIIWFLIVFCIMYICSELFC